MLKESAGEVDISSEGRRNRTNLQCIQQFGHEMLKVMQNRKSKLLPPGETKKLTFEEKSELKMLADQAKDMVETIHELLKTLGWLC